MSIAINDALQNELYPLKHIVPPNGTDTKKVPVLLQQHNGPCSFLALCNVLLLTHKISIPASHRDAVPYSVMADLVANYILSRDKQNPLAIESVLDIIPKTRTGLDIDPCFDKIDRFSEGSEKAGEMLLFRLAGVPLVHGFLADKDDFATWEALVERANTFDLATMRVAAADELLDGHLLSEDHIKLDMTELDKKRLEWSSEQNQVVQDGILIQNFLSRNAGQLSYAGLFELAEGLTPGSLAALFRGNHLSVLYRSPFDSNSDTSSKLYNLITDSSFQYESLVWEALDDIEGSTQFFDAYFQPTQTVGGEYVRTRRPSTMTQDPDHIMAIQMQQEEYQFRATHRDPEQGQNHGNMKHKVNRDVQTAPAANISSNPQPTSAAVVAQQSDRTQSSRNKKQKCIIA